ncbi:MAG: hypothetical protein R3F43_26805 [bacterium]
MADDQDVCPFVANPIRRSCPAPLASPP